MMIPQFFDDLTGDLLTEADMHHVTVQTANRRPQEFHFSSAALQFMLNPALMGVGEIVRLLREQNFAKEGALNFSSKCADGKYSIQVAWEFDMDEEHFQSYQAFISSLTVDKVTLTTGKSGNEIRLTFETELT